MGAFRNAREGPPARGGRAPPRMKIVGSLVSNAFSTLFSWQGLGGNFAYWSEAEAQKERSRPVVEAPIVDFDALRASRPQFAHCAIDERLADPPTLVVRINRNMVDVPGVRRFQMNALICNPFLAPNVPDDLTRNVGDQKKVARVRSELVEEGPCRFLIQDREKHLRVGLGVKRLDLLVQPAQRWRVALLDAAYLQPTSTRWTGLLP